MKYLKTARYLKTYPNIETKLVLLIKQIRNSQQICSFFVAIAQLNEIHGDDIPLLINMFFKYSLEFNVVFSHEFLHYRLESIAFSLSFRI